MGESVLKMVIEQGSQTGTVFRLHDGMNTLGREPSNRIRLFDPRISRNHCKIRKVGKSLLVIDLGTRNGTLVNGNAVKRAELEVGDCVKIGNTVLRVADDEYEPPRATGKPSSSPSFLHHISGVFGGKRRRQKLNISSAEFEQLVSKSRRGIWKPPLDTDPPETKRTTLE